MVTLVNPYPFLKRNPMPPNTLYDPQWGIPGDRKGPCPFHVGGAHFIYHPPLTISCFPVPQIDTALPLTEFFIEGHPKVG